MSKSVLCGETERKIVTFELCRRIKIIDTIFSSVGQRNCIIKSISSVTVHVSLSCFGLSDIFLSGFKDWLPLFSFC